MHPCFTQLNFVYLHLFFLPKSVQEEESLLAQSKLTSTQYACSQVGCLEQNLARTWQATREQKFPLGLKRSWRAWTIYS